MPKGNVTPKERMNQRRGAAQQDGHKSTLFVENVPDEYTEDEIKGHIGDFHYRRVNIVRRDGKSMGKAFIELESAEEAQACLSAINGQHWSYCVVNAQLSKPKPKQSDSMKPNFKPRPKSNATRSSYKIKQARR